MLLTLSLWYVEVKVQNILKLKTNLLTTCFYKVFFKKKEAGTGFPTSFSTQILKKKISHVIIYQLTKFHCQIDFSY